MQAVGTTDYLADADTQQRPNSSRPAKVPDASGEWDIVYGEFLTFDDPRERLPALDGLEGFDPGGSSLYRRVLVPVQLLENKKITLAWVYVVDNPSGAYLRGGRWPA